MTAALVFFQGGKRWGEVEVIGSKRANLLMLDHLGHAHGHEVPSDHDSQSSLLLASLL